MPPGTATAPRRVLIVSADIGGGHHATGRALEAAVREHWPQAAVVWVDTLEVMRAGPAFRSIYRANVQWTPWLYDFFYDQIWRHRWFARSSKWVTSVWAGRRLAPVLRRVQPDLVLSTYPLGSGGLAWLRRHGRLAVPVGAWISDFAPHPFWVHGPLDLHVVMHASCVALAHRAEPRATVVGPAALPVVPEFTDGDRTVARKALELAPDRYTVLVSCGVYGFGAVEEAVDVLLAESGERVQVVVATGRNAALHRRLERRPAAGPEGGNRLVVLGWSDRMSEFTRAADVVVTNAGGATALEALACGRPVVMFRPIAGHGIANAESMVAAGVAVLSRNGTELAAAFRELLDDGAHRARLDAAVAACSSGGSLADDLERLMTGRMRPSVPDSVLLSGADAFWVHLDGERVPQRVAALALIRPGSTSVTAEVIGDALAAVVPVRPWLTWRLDDRPGRRPRWLTGEPCEVLPVTPLELGGRRTDPAGVFDEFVARPFIDGEPVWEVQVAEDWPDGRTAMLIRAHHAFGDGFAVLDAFTGIASRRPVAPGRPALGAPAPVVPPAPAAPRTRRPLRDVGRSAGATARGLVSLARAGAAPATPLAARRSGSRPARHAFVTLPDATVRAAARVAGVGTSDLLLGVIAEAIHRFLVERGTPSPPGTVRAMVPRTLRVGGGRGPGNRTSAVRIDLLVGRMPAVQRVRAARDAVAAAVAAGQTAGSSAVLGLAARLPPRLHAAAARWLYRSAWFDVIVSVIPGPRTARWIGTARIEQAYAVLPLAEGVGLAVGVLAWNDVLAVSFTWDPVLLPDGGRLSELLRPALDAVASTP